MKKTSNNIIYQETKPEFIQEFASDVGAGLSNPRKFLPSKYFYDKNGSHLFEQISRLPEYYLTRTEASILNDNSSEIVQILNSSRKGGSRQGDDDGGISVIELGSGSSIKTRILLNQLLATNTRICYFPIDISYEMLQETTTQLKAQLPSIDVIGIPMDYGQGVEEVNRIINANTRVIPNRRLILFLGSSIGNFEPSQAASFIYMLKKNMMSEQDYLLIGFDLHKDAEVLEAAYDDKDKVTAKFNLNLLERINRELDANFDINSFSHRAFYNKSMHRIEMHLESDKDQVVHISALSEKYSFKKGETINTENSYKYTLNQISRLVEQSDLSVRAIFTDKRKWFALALLGHIQQTSQL
jgi:L-histidine N-alpha-methyltransferase